MPCMVYCVFEIGTIKGKIERTKSQNEFGTEQFPERTSSERAAQSQSKEKNLGFRSHVSINNGNGRVVLLFGISFLFGRCVYVTISYTSLSQLYVRVHIWWRRSPFTALCVYYPFSILASIRCTFRLSFPLSLSVGCRCFVIVISFRYTNTHRISHSSTHLLHFGVHSTVRTKDAKGRRRRLQKTEYIFNTGNVLRTHTSRALVRAISASRPADYAIKYICVKMEKRNW